MKLNLMGLDYCSVDCGDVDGLTEDEFLSIYAHEDLPDNTYYSVLADGKPIIRYLALFKDSRRRNMAIHEHLRWNSFMISRGMVPATRKQILEETKKVGEKIKYTNGKNYSVRRHGNLTTFDGLIEFRRMIAQRDKKEDETLLQAEERNDVIKYDYQLLDDAYWLLKKTDHKIIRKI